MQTQTKIMVGMSSLVIQGWLSAWTQPKIVLYSVTMMSALGLSVLNPFTQGIGQASVGMFTDF